MKKNLLLFFALCCHIVFYSQSITSVVPNESEQGESLQVTVTGDNTSWAQSSNTLFFKQSSNTIYPYSQSVNSDTEIVGYFSFQYFHSTGVYDVSVKEIASGDEVVLANGFQLNEGVQPQITSVNPNQGEQVTALTVTVTGESIGFTQGSPVIFLQASNVPIFPASQNVLSDTVIECDFLLNPDHPVGFYDVRLFAEPVELENGFEVLAATVFPQLDGFTPDTASQGETITLSISGTDTHFDHFQVANEVYLISTTSSVYGYNTQVINDSTLEADFTFEYYHIPGSFDLKVFNQLDGTLLLENSFTLEPGADAPAITLVEPDSAMQTEEVWVTFTGENVDFSQGSVTLYLHQPNGTIIYPDDQNVLNDTVVEADFFFNPDQNTGYYDVKFENSLLYLQDGFYLSPPEEFPDEPTNEPTTGNTDEPLIMIITVENAHFDYPDLETSVSLLLNRDEGINAESVMVIDSNMIEAEFNFLDDDTPGLYDLKIFNQLDGTILVPEAFTLEGDTTSQLLTDINPDNADQGESLWITISGQNTIFTSGSATIKLMQGSATIIFPLDENILSDTQIEGDFTFSTDHPTGYYDVYVYDLNGNWTVNTEDGFFLSQGVSIEESGEVKIGRVYPNPAADILFVERGTGKRNGIAVDILNLAGEVIHINEMTASQNILRMDISNFESGIYLIKLRSGNEVRIEKFVIR